MGGVVKRLFTVLFWVSSISLVSGLHAQQQIDAQFGISGMNAPSATNFDLNDFNHSPQSLSGGVYPSFAADFILFRNFGFNGEVAWRATRATYPDVNLTPYRPIFYDFNAVYAKKTGRVGFVAMGGIGAESIRFYGDFQNCNNLGQCTNYVSSNHFMGDFGAGVRVYFWHNAFIRPEVRLYLINNNVEFSSSYATRYSISLGYSFGGR